MATVAGQAWPIDEWEAEQVERAWERECRQAAAGAPRPCLLAQALRLSPGGRRLLAYALGRSLQDGDGGGQDGPGCSASTSRG